MSYCKEEEDNQKKTFLGGGKKLLTFCFEVFSRLVLNQLVALLTLINSNIGGKMGKTEESHKQKYK